MCWWRKVFYHVQPLVSKYRHIWEKVWLTLRVSNFEIRILLFPVISNTKVTKLCGRRFPSFRASSQQSTNRRFSVYTNFCRALVFMSVKINRTGLLAAMFHSLFFKGEFYVRWWTNHPVELSRQGPKPVDGQQMFVHRCTRECRHRFHSSPKSSFSSAGALINKTFFLIELE